MFLGNVLMDIKMIGAYYHCNSEGDKYALKYPKGIMKASANWQRTQRQPQSLPGPGCITNPFTLIPQNFWQGFYCK